MPTKFLTALLFIFFRLKSPPADGRLIKIQLFIVTKVGDHFALWTGKRHEAQLHQKQILAVPLVRATDRINDIGGVVRSNVF